MNGGIINKKVKVPAERDVRINDEIQQWGFQKHAVGTDRYESGIIVLRSKNMETLHEAVLITENFLSYNGSWDIERQMNKRRGGFRDLFRSCFSVLSRGKSNLDDNTLCTSELRFKWNGYLSIYENIIHKLKLPTGVDVEINLYGYPLLD
ncbi:MAG: hypothetical protein K5662_05935 [Lachnospiraceae bacterium]|nr:hypothetical protein [Lachnospiraceae bacterium]